MAAAVIGAGGNMETAEVVFRNITSAIKATGGGAQDVESAITAMVQMFSKGKISPKNFLDSWVKDCLAAVTAFAEANDISTPELAESMLRTGRSDLIN